MPPDLLVEGTRHPPDRSVRLERFPPAIQRRDPRSEQRIPDPRQHTSVGGRSRAPQARGWPFVSNGLRPPPVGQRQNCETRLQPSLCSGAPRFEEHETVIQLNRPQDQNTSRFLCPHCRHTPLRSRALHELFGLTPPEIRTCIALLEGKSVEEYAHETAISSNTARTCKADLFEDRSETAE
jgi:hypothetical protein